MDDSGLFCGELVLSAILVFLQQKTKIAKPRIASDFFNVFEQAGVFVVLCPAFYDGIEGSQSCVLIYPSPVARSEVFQFSLDSFLRLL